MQSNFPLKEVIPQFHYIGNKAGVVEQDEIKLKIEQATKGSSYYERQKQKTQIYNQKIQQMNQKLQQYRQDHTLVNLTKELAAQLINQYRNNLKLDRVWAHFDMDMFYVACELLERPDLKDKPCAVGGTDMISAANYVARKYGVRSAMPGFVAKQLCPNLILLPHHFEKYKNISDIFMRILRENDSQLESMGLDEANIDITEVLSYEGIQPNQTEKIIEFCEKIRQRVNEATQLTASCGIGPNKMIAKLASEQKKPNGIFAVSNSKQEVEDFVQNLSIRKIPGVGNVMEQLLKGIGILNCLDLREKTDEIIQVFSEKTYQFLISSSWGYSRNFHIEAENPLSVSCQRTFAATTDRQELEKKIEELSGLVAEELILSNRVGLQVVLNIKTQRFEVQSKSVQLSNYTNQSLEIQKNAKKILSEMLPVEPIRLLGVKISQLKNEDQIKKQSLQGYFEKQIQSQKSKVQIEVKIVEEKSQNDVQQNSNSDQSSLLKSDFIQNRSLCPICNLSKMNRHIDQCLGIVSNTGAESLQISNINQKDLKSKGLQKFGKVQSKKQ